MMMSRRQALIDGYKTDYDEHIITSLIDTIVEEESNKVLLLCASVMQSKHQQYGDAYKSMAIEGKDKLLINLNELIKALIIVYGSQKHIDTFAKAMHVYREKYVKSFDAMQAGGAASKDKVFSDIEITGQVQSYTFACNYRLAVINTLPQRDAIIKIYQSRLTSKYTENIKKKPFILNIPPQAHQSFLMTIILDDVIKKICGVALADKISAESTLAYNKEGVKAHS